MNSFWFSYILFIIFLGAMLVPFIYVASLASNESLKFSSSLLFVFVFTALASFLVMFMDPMLMNAPIPFHYLMSSTPALLSAMYKYTTMNLTLFIVLYLLLTLIVVVKITITFFGPLRLSSS